MSNSFGVSDLTALIETDEKPTLLDVRTTAEFETAHIPGSYNVPLDTLGEHRDDIAKAMEGEVVLICRSGKRAAQAGRRFAEIGMTNVHVLEGGVMAWESAGRDLTRGRERWDLERQVRLVAGAIVALSILLSIWLPAMKWVAGAIGAGLTIAALTNTCAMGMLLSRLPYNRVATCDTSEVVEQLKAAATTH